MPYVYVSLLFNVCLTLDTSLNTFQVAKEILDKYGGPDEQIKALKPFVPTNNVPGNPPSTPTPGSFPLYIIQE